MNAVYFSSVVLHLAVVVDTVRYRKSALALQTDLTDRYFDQKCNNSLAHIHFARSETSNLSSKPRTRTHTDRHMRKRLTAVLGGVRQVSWGTARGGAEGIQLPCRGGLAPRRGKIRISSIDIYSSVLLPRICMLFD